MCYGWQIGVVLYSNVQYINVHCNKYMLPECSCIINWIFYTGTVVTICHTSDRYRDMEIITSYQAVCVTSLQWWTAFITQTHTHQVSRPTVQHEACTDISNWWENCHNGIISEITGGIISAMCYSWSCNNHEKHMPQGTLHIFLQSTQKTLNTITSKLFALHRTTQD